MRVTTNSMMRNYNSSLNRVLSDLDTTRQRVNTKRKYLKASESPANAAKAYRLRREMSKTEDYLSNVKNVQSTYDTLESSIMSLSSYADDVSIKAMEGVTGTMSESQRKIIATEIRTIQNASVMELNSKFEGEYLFGGSSTKELPFQLSDDGKLLFRGLDVNAPVGSDDYKTLEKLSNETIFIDLGFGMTLDTENHVEQSSAFNVSMPGIKFMGFGKDANGISNNVITTMGDIANILDSKNYNMADLKPYTDRLTEERTTILVNVTQLGSTTKFLENTKMRLEDNEFSLNKKINNTEYIDLEVAITDFKMQEYVYNAALKMGTRLLSSSFIDFMN